jgi:SAM-dependent methyltransferase
VIPGLVDADLFNEHLARYRFAARFPQGRSLDVGCGTGYGTTGVGIDVSAEALAYAREHNAAARFVQASAEAIPFADGSFGLVTAFEVIEHLAGWAEMLREANRVLTDSGILLVSTPNKACYTEMRGEHGPNPFHVHEFEYSEFEGALREVFPHVRIWTQNHADSIVFAPREPEGVALDAGGDSNPENALFFIAACSRREIGYRGLYCWTPASANVLREKERHIARLEGELALKDEWLARLKADHSALQGKHETTVAELKARGVWAAQQDREIEARDSRIKDLQNEAKERLAWAYELEARVAELDGLIAEAQGEITKRTRWALSLEEQLDTRTRHVQIIREELDGYKAAYPAAQDEIAALKKRVESLITERSQIAQSKWLRFGRRLKLGPVVDE